MIVIILVWKKEFGKELVRIKLLQIRLGSQTIKENFIGRLEYDMINNKMILLRDPSMVNTLERINYNYVKL